jgi:hypothetical protein
VPGSLGTTPWAPDRTATFDGAVAIAGVVVTVLAAVLVVVGVLRARTAPATPTTPTTKEESDV